MYNINLLYYLLAGTIFGLLTLKTGIPEAPGGISGMSSVGSEYGVGAA